MFHTLHLSASGVSLETDPGQIDQLRGRYYTPVVLIRKFSSKRLTSLWKPFALPLKTLLKPSIGITSTIIKRNCLHELLEPTYKSKYCRTKDIQHKTRQVTNITGDVQIEMWKCIMLQSSRWTLSRFFNMPRIDRSRSLMVIWRISAKNE